MIRSVGRDFHLLFQTLELQSADSWVSHTGIRYELMYQEHTSQCAYVKRLGVSWAFFDSQGHWIYHLHTISIRQDGIIGN
jgi:hypothetical protein